MSHEVLFRRVFRGRRVLITGGLGFIGSNLARELVGLGARVTIVDALIPEYGGNRHNLAGIASRVRVHFADVRDRKRLPTFVRGQDFVFNLAGQTSHMDSMTDPDTDLEINCRAQLSILEACRCHNPGVRIVFASTRQIYGRPEFLPVNERHPLRPVDVNGINKLAGEQYHLLYSEVYGIRGTVLRLTNTIGPRMRVKDARQTFLGVWIKQVLSGERFEVWGGQQLRDFTYVDDAVDALLLAAARPVAVGQVYNLGGSGRISLRALADFVIDSAGGGSYRVKKFPAERKKIDIGDYYADDRRIRRELGWRPRIGIREGVERTVEFFRAKLPHYL
jgi:UDP-glucose 4-epimerase